MKFEERKRIYLDYIRLKTEEEDWHGVSDAANDLRELYLEEQLKKDLKATVTWFVPSTNPPSIDETRREDSYE